jgi:hypothetical protein
LIHKTITESPRAMLQDLGNVEKVYVEKYNKKAKVNKAKVSTASKADDRHVPRKRANGGSSDRHTPRKGKLPSMANGERLMVGLSLRATPPSVASLIMTAGKRTSLLSPLIPQRSPGKRVAEIPARWLI